MAIANLKKEVRHTLTDEILPFWMDKMKDPRGGFYPEMTSDGTVVPDSPKGCILNARILWTFSAAYRFAGDALYIRYADRAYDEVKDKFIDREYGGTYWSVDADGRPVETRKQFYAIAFVIYALAEYFRATGRQEALDEAVALYECIQKYSLDTVKGGYLEALSQNWQPMQDVRLSDKDKNAVKTMNTHLHILEAYTNLYRVWKDEGLHSALRGLIEIFLDRIIRDNGHLGLFFDDDWNLDGSVESFGHDIETSWLLQEAAEVLGDADILDRVLEKCNALASAAMEGIGENGGLYNEFDPSTGVWDKDCHWWPQAECIVGCIFAMFRTNEPLWLERAERCWSFVRKYLVRPDGEWTWRYPENPEDPVAGFWKCPYHNSRMCLELLNR